MRSTSPRSCECIKDVSKANELCKPWYENNSDLSANPALGAFIKNFVTDYGWDVDSDQFAIALSTDTWTSTKNHVKVELDDAKHRAICKHFQPQPAN